METAQLNDTNLNDTNVNGSCDVNNFPIPRNNTWWIYIVTYVIIFFVCFGLSCFSYGIYYLVVKKCNPQQSRHQHKSSKLKKMHEFVRQLISGDTYPSKIYIGVTFFCNVVYMILTVYRAYQPLQIEYCFSLNEDPARIIELLVVIELLTFFLVRLLASNNIIWFWLNIYTIVDIITLPHIFISIALGVDWLGLRSVRFFWLNQIVSVFRFIPFVQSQDIIDLFSLCIYFIVLLFFGTGIVHLLEFTGDPWRDFENAQTQDDAGEFFTYAYFIIVTITTVGYGDISPMTAFGRIFMVGYIIIGLAFFAALLPVISDVISAFNAKRQYAHFDRSRVPSHVIVCGHITAFSAQEFLKDFLHPDRGDKHTHILFLHPTRPNKELKNVLRSYYTRVQYIAGSVLNSNDLQKSKLLSSSAVFILADKYTNIPLEEDNGNLLRLVSIKNTTSDIPVIIQLLLGANKKQVSNIEGWNKGLDIAVCLNELKLGLLAQSCICPGFSTLIANLFYTSDFPILTSFEGPDAWKEGYIQGASNEIYATHFSPSFEGKNFQEAASICYNKLGLIMLAFESPEGMVRKFHVNPSSELHPEIVVQTGVDGTRGYFIGQDIEHVSVVANYCEACDGDTNICAKKHHLDKEVNSLVRKVSKRKCHCFTDLEGVTTKGGSGNELLVETIGFQGPKRPSHISLARDDEENLEKLNAQYSLCLGEPQKLDDAILNSEYDLETAELPTLRDHIVLCVFADEKSPLLGLHNFLYPLRSHNIPKDSMKPVVIISNRIFLQREWQFIRKIPDVHVVDGSPLRVQNLEAASVESCSVCIIITMLSASNDEPAINDKEVVLCSLSIQKYLKRFATRQVQVITDLRQESNVQFLDFGDEDEPDERIYKAQPFACGEAFSVSMMDSVTSSAFHTPGTLYLVEDLIKSSASKTNFQIVAMPLDRGSFSGSTFQDLYNDQLSRNNLVLGLYRKLSDAGPKIDLLSGAPLRPNRKSVTSSTGQVKHYVVTAPHPATKLELSDIAFVLVNNCGTPVEPQPLGIEQQVEINIHVQPPLDTVSDTV